MLSKTVVGTLEDTVATAADDGPRPEPVVVLWAKTDPVEVTLAPWVNWSAGLARPPTIVLRVETVAYWMANMMPCSPPATSLAVTVVGLWVPTM